MTQAIYDAIAALPDELFEPLIKDYSTYRGLKKPITLKELKELLKQSCGGFYRDSGNYVKTYYITIGGYHLLSCKTAPFPSCCAMGLFYDFHTCRCPEFEPLIHAILDIVIAQDNGFRYVMAIPEMRSGHTHRKDIFTAPKYRETTSYNYPMIYSWAKSKPHFQEMLFTNHNTARVIHNCEFVVKDETSFNTMMDALYRQ